MFLTQDGESSSPRRHLLVLINPIAGKGRGESVFIKQVQPMFEMAEIEFKVIVTGMAKLGYLLSLAFNGSQCWCTKGVKYKSSFG